MDTTEGWNFPVKNPASRQSHRLSLSMDLVVKNQEQITSLGRNLPSLNTERYSSRFMYVP